MQMYTIELGKAGAEGFKLIESTNVLASGTEAARARLVDTVRTRGAQIGANRARLLAEGRLVMEYP